MRCRFSRLRLRFLIPALMAGMLPVQAWATPHGGGGYPSSCGCIPVEHDSAFTRLLKQRAMARTLGVLEASPETLLNRYPVLPMGGVLNGDLSMNNLVDLNPAAGAVLDAFGGAVTYDGHGGHDIDLVGFTEQDLGVPVFAVLDGTVAETHDGEFDRNTSFTNAPANYVILDHGNTHQTYYWHLRKNSVAVNPGQSVKAGQFLGWTGSSGNSTNPHLHFETRVDGTVIEPFTGPSRPSASLWLNQPVLQPTRIRRAFLTEVPPDTWNGLDPISRRAVWNTGTPRLNFVIHMVNGPKPGSNYRFHLVRPDQTLANQTGPTNWGGNYRTTWWWWYFHPNLNQTGTWRLEFFLNNELALQLPFEVVASGSLPNRAPAPLDIAFTKPHYASTDVPVCQAATVNPVPDPDYDPVSYQWVWKKNGSIIRSSVHGGLADMVPKDSGVPGDVISCEVTATDGTLSAATRTVTATIYEPYEAWAARQGTAAASIATDTDGDGIPAAAEYWLGTSPAAREALPLPVRDPATGKLGLTLPRKGFDPSVSLTVFSSHDLTQWQAAAVDAAGQVWTSALAPSNREFMRLVLTRGPGGPAATVTLAEVSP